MRIQKIINILKTTFWDFYEDHLWFEMICRLVCFLAIVHLFLFSFSKVVGRSLYLMIPLPKFVFMSGFAFWALLYCSLWYKLYERKHRSLGLQLSFHRLVLIGLGVVLGFMMHSIIFGWRYCLLGGSMQWNPNWEIVNCIQGFIAVFFAAGVEELLFRGYVLLILRYWIGLIPAVLITSSLFGVAHLTNEGVPHSEPLIVGLMYSITGVFYAVAYLSTKTIWFPVAIHAGWNWLSFSIKDGPDHNLLEWLEPVIIYEKNNTGLNYIIQSQWLPMFFLKVTMGYFLICHNKALYRILSNYIYKTEAGINDSS